MSPNTPHAPSPTENIIHRTASRPFSLHHTLVGKEETCALYLHCHPEAELFYLEQGKLEFQIENRTYVLCAGEGIFIPPDLIHSALNLTDAREMCSYRAIVFSVALLEKSLPPYCQPYFTPLYLQRLDCIYPITRANPANDKLLSLLPSLFSFQETALDRYELALTGSLLLCWQELYNHCFSQAAESTPRCGNQTELTASLTYIQQHFSEPLTLADLAASAGFSEGYFCHSFKSFTGYSPFVYLNRIRIVKSCELLIQTDKKITEIASLCGFNNISYFNRTFYKMMHLTPSGYRKAFSAAPLL
ncbi:MAG: helix-turn-helix domain-containing protein [Lachnospiraceae bacterium]|nr:helix-turn-helix domain-containing protein [Lachnospiraceae bacterium]